MTIRFCVFDGYEMKPYEFDSKEKAKVWADYQIAKFKVRNRVVDESKDGYFMAYKSQFDEILEHAEG